MKIYYLFLFILSGLYFTTISAQNIEVRGVVLDETDNPLVGVTLKSDIQNKGTITDLEGKFKISCNINEKLIVSYIGFIPMTIKVSDKPMVIKLQPQTVDLNEVVVVGYGTQKRSDISTAVSSIKIEDVEKSGNTNVLEAIQGKISGVQIISNDGSLNGAMTFRIRGNNSITGGTQPLFIIDGVPQPIVTGDNDNYNPLGGLNPSDIESMEILKDAAAAAIYGAEGSNGVVLISTKKGSTQSKSKIELSGKSGVDFPPLNNMQVLNPEDYARKMHTFATSNFMPYWQNIIDNELWNDPLIVQIPLNQIQQTAYKNELNASISGGNKDQNYFISVGYLSNKGIIKGTSYDRFSMRANLMQKLGRSIEVSSNLSYSSSQDKNSFTDAASRTGVYLRALQASPFMNAPDFTEIYDVQGLDLLNPINMISDRQTVNKYDDLNGKINFRYDISGKGLIFNTSISAKKFFYNSSEYNGPKTGSGFLTRGLIVFNNRNDFNWTYEARLQYNKRIRKHVINAMSAFEAKNWQRIVNTVKTTNFDDNSLGIYGVASGLVPYAPTLSYDGYSMLSFIGRIGYSYDNRYVLNASIRRDGSSRFGANNKFGNFPAISLAWRASQEKFFKSARIISDLKFRASYGVTGNNQFPSYQSLAVLENNKVVFDGSTVETGRYPLNIQNKELKWESSKQYNVGVDISAIRNRISLTADFYYKRIDDMLINVNIPSTTGYKSAWQNAGSMMNKGMEYGLKTVILNGNKLKWTADFNIAFNQNKLLSLSEGQYEQYYSRGINEKVTNDVLLRVGMPVGIYYGYISDGVYNNTNELMNGLPGSNYKFNDLKIVDTNNDGKIDAYDRVPVANVNPLHTGGFGTNLSYDGFELYAFFRWSYGNDQINGAAYYLTYANSFSNILSTVYPNLWSVENPSNDYPAYNTSSFGTNVFRSEFVEDGSFLRLSTLSLSYSLNSKLISKFGIRKCNVAITGSNLFLLTRYSGFDPEANTGSSSISRIAPGLDMSPYPRPRSISFSINLGI